MMNFEKFKPKNEKKARLIFIGGIVLFALVMFRVLLTPGAILFTTDDNIGAMAIRKAAIPGSFLGWWYDTILLGMSAMLFVNWTNLLLWIFPVQFFSNWIHALDLGFASLFLALFLRLRGRSWAACALAALTAFWVGTNFTLTYAGHIGKFGVLFFAALSLWLSEKAVQQRSVGWAVLAGGALGAMFLEQADVGLFVAMGIGPYVLYRCISEYGLKWKPVARILIPLVLLTGFMAFRALVAGAGVSEQGSMADENNPKEKWEFATQWSWPPEESVDFVAPGYMGWRSGEQEGPYYGRMGRSAQWESTKQGFRNFKLENQYMGMIPVLLALWGGIVGWLLRKEDRRYRDGLFWATAVIVALLLSFGKYFPVYRMLYALPGISSIRNPNKFLHLFQIGVGVLAAYGLDAVYARGLGKDLADKLRRKTGTFGWLVLGLAVLFFLFWLGRLTSWGQTVSAYEADGWAGQAGAIVSGQIHALFVAFLMAVFTFVLILLARKNPVRFAWAPWAVAALVAVDAVLLSGHYISKLPKSFVAENDLVKFLKSNRQHGRTALVRQDDFYNILLTYMFPYYSIPSVNYTQMPRMPRDYKQFLGAFGRNVPAMWPLMGVTDVLLPAPMWAQAKDQPPFKDNYEVAFAYNVRPQPDGNMKITVSTQSDPGRECVIRPKPGMSRFALISGWDILPREEMLSVLTSGSFVPLKQVLVSSETAGDLEPEREGGQIGNIQLTDYRPGRIALKISTEKAAILRIAEYYDPDWHVKIGGKESDLLCCDYLFMGTHVEAGLWPVVFEYRPPLGSFWIQMFAILCCAGAGAVLFLRRRKKEPEQA